ncbi:SRPBCC family protein [Bradyrhizobium sp. BR13661]|jgi:hypothetical protein|uniref:SRPBCC family protein n=1 Tax=Bradyrhizobium sp. BR13661 TaxID=2940622 RepID=UPI002474A0D7|nr:SRPBCC family protein [Bradyrhizobium sp. BR13661]MDH6260396.1 uncharacterized protein YndB with AHSA1/START domain [Bradyrhizobium sp. BR13661]
MWTLTANAFARPRMMALALSTAVLAMSWPAGAEEASAIRTMEKDFAARSGDIHWPDGFTPVKADLFAHNETVINAACEKVWSKIVDVRQWPDWYPNSKEVTLTDDAKLITSQGKFRWRTFGIEVESSVREFVVNERLGWFGNVPGKAPEFYHTWLLKPEAGNCRVVTEEVGIGAGPAGFRATNESLLHRGHELWVVGLKWISEL